MSTALRVITAIFYVLTGLTLLLSASPSPTVLRGIFAELLYATATRIALSLWFIAAGAASGYALSRPHHTHAHLVAAGLRASSMSTLALLLILVYLFMPGVKENIYTLIVFTYLAALALLTAPPPLPPPIAEALDTAREQQRHDVQ